MICNKKIPVSVLIMCQNEEINIGYTLDSIIDDFDQIVVVDSYSSDRTKSIVCSYRGIDFYENRFVGWAEQRNWMLQNCIINNEVVLFLDSDEVLSKRFIRELDEIIHNEFDAIEFGVDMYFMGCHIKFAYGHPTIKRIFKRDKVIFFSDGAREYASYQGIVLKMRERIIHEDRRGLYYWIDKHNNNSTREANVYINTDNSTLSTKVSKINILSRTKMFIRKSVWDRLPMYFRPFIYFIYRYIVQLGFLDGRAGFVYCFFHALWYPMLIDAKIEEAKYDKKIRK